MSAGKHNSSLGVACQCVFTASKNIRLLTLVTNFFSRASKHVATPKYKLRFLHHLRTTWRKSNFSFRGPRSKPHTPLYNVEATRTRFNFCRAPAGLNIVKRSVQKTFPEKLKLLSRRVVRAYCKNAADKQSPRLFERSLQGPSTDIRFFSGLSSRR